LKFLYSLAFLLGADNWKLEQLPVEITQTLKDFDRVNTKILDLGCGEGRECIALAADGWDVIGVDFIPLAIRRANNAARKAQVLDRTTFYPGDVSKLHMLDLPPIQLAYDIGCFHLLDSEQVEGFISGLSDIVVPGGIFLLNAFTPRQQGKKMVGYDPEAVEALFSETFVMKRMTEHSYWRFPANWYWLRRRKRLNEGRKIE